MGTIKMMQGDSYYVFIEMTQYEEILLPETVDDLEICVGEALRYSVSGGTVGFDTASQRWFFRPTQEETLSLDPGQYNVIVRVKYANDPLSDVKGVPVGRIIISDTYSEEVL
jgi:hypothetical protein